MKYFIVALMGMLLATSSCKDAIDITQPGLLDADRALETVTDLNLGLLGVYNKFDYSPAIKFNSVFTDQATIGFDSGGQGITNGEYGFVLNGSSAIASAQWANYYSALNAASRVIEASANVTVGDGEQSNFNNLLGQTYALRAWAHFELLTYFSTDLTDDNALGVILLNFVPSVEQQLGRSTNGEVFASIESDLSQAASLVTEQSNALFVSKDFITALRARMAAYRGNYTEADGFAAQLLSSYPLANRTQYTDMYLDQDNSEIIFKLDRTKNDDYDVQGITASFFAGGWAGASFAFIDASVDGSPYYEMSNDLFNLLDPADVRYDVLIHPSSDLQRNILSIGKYPGSNGVSLMNDLKIFRSSEMLLIRAEAAAAANDLTGAASFLDQLHDARFGSNQNAPSFASQADAFKAILTERRIELAYEGFRWVDMKRLGTKAGVSGFERTSEDCAINDACSLSTTSHKLVALPIPLIETDANTTIKAQQNPGY